MIAVGELTEMQPFYAISFCPQCAVFWLMGWILSNVAPLYYCMSITCSFYRYGHMIPIPNVLDIQNFMFKYSKTQVEKIPLNVLFMDNFEFPIFHSDFRPKPRKDHTIAVNAIA